MASPWQANRFRGEHVTPVLGVCMHCGTAIKPGTRNTYVEVTGWELVGTSGKLKLQKGTGRVACWGCGPTGQSTEQEQLF